MWLMMNSLICTQDQIATQLSQMDINFETKYLQSKLQEFKLRAIYVLPYVKRSLFYATMQYFYILPIFLILDNQSMF